MCIDLEESESNEKDEITKNVPIENGTLEVEKIGTLSIADQIKGRYYALIIGIDNYSGDWPKLNNAVRDAKAVEDVLRTDYRFDKIITLYDNEATRTEIFDTFEWLVENVIEDDNVLIYFSGHRELKKNLKKGFWVPVDAAT